MVRFLAQTLLIVVVFIAAWRRGGQPERYVASIYLLMLLASGTHAFVGGPETDADYAGLHAFRFTLDCTAFAAVVAVALRYDRWWALWVGSAQFIAVMAHLLKALNLPLPPIAYAVMERWPIWVAVILTGWGTFLYHRRSTRTSADTSLNS